MTAPAKSKLRLGLIAGLGILITLGAVTIRAEWGLSQAEKFAAMEDWRAVRKQLDWYLRLHPRSARAHLLMARAFASDRQFDADAAQAAIGHLDQVSLDSEFAASAQLDAGRLELLGLHRPRHAERHFRQAIDLDPQLFQAQFLLWKVWELTGRARQAEPEFWRVYELSPQQTRIVRLREWYLSQFYPEFANAPLDQTLGFLRPQETPTDLVERRRLDRFREAEPNEPLAAIAIAQWYQRRGDLQAARKALNELSATIDAAYDDPYFVATLVAVLLELGDFDRAQQAFDQWPAEDRQHAYWRSHAILLDDADANYADAVAAYDKALAIWPGPIDWRTQARKANCLARTGQMEQAQLARQASRETQAKLESPLHERVRIMLGKLDRNEKLEEVVTFYRQLGCDREADCWQKEIAAYRGGDLRAYPPPLNVPLQ